MGNWKPKKWFGPPKVHEATCAFCCEILYSIDRSLFLVMVDTHYEEHFNKHLDKQQAAKDDKPRAM